MFNSRKVLGSNVNLHIFSKKKLDFGKNKGFKTFGGEMVIRAPAGSELFVQGENVLVVTINNSGTSANPMGFCAKGKALVGHR